MCAFTQRTFTSPGPWPLSSGERQFPSSSPITQSVSQSVRPSVRPSQNSPPHPEKRRGHKTRDPIPKKGSVTKLATSSRKKARSQNSRSHPEKRLGHKTRHPIPKKGSVTKLATPSRKKARSQNSRPHPEKRLGHKTRDPRTRETTRPTIRAIASQLSRDSSYARRYS